MRKVTDVYGVSSKKIVTIVIIGLIVLIVLVNSFQTIYKFK